jgi:hypothetical protein
MLSLLHSGLSLTHTPPRFYTPIRRNPSGKTAHTAHTCTLYDLLVRKSTVTFPLARSRNKSFSVSFSLFPTLSLSILPLLPSFTPLFFSLFSLLFPLSHTMASLLILLVYITSTSFSPSFPNTGF